MKKAFSLLFHRVTIAGLIILMQAAAIILMIGRFARYFPQFYAFSTVLSAAVVIVIVSGTDKSAYKIAWIIPIIIFPIFGGLFYLLLGNRKPNKRMRRKMEETKRQGQISLALSETLLGELAKEDPQAANQARYIQNHGAFPLYRHSYSKFFPLGELAFEAMLKELQQAQHYIFLEYFIIREGSMWQSILEILVEKAQAGLDVRLIYDDLGCAFALPANYHLRLESLGIKTARFHPLKPVLSARLNNRDHRKLMIIDGHTAFTGGINLADEYINAQEKYGHWKDSAFLLKGESVWSLVIMFLTMWDYLRDSPEDLSQYKPRQLPAPPRLQGGYIQPFGDNPLDQETVGETVYLNLITRAKEYVYINTPYLILDNEMITALTAAAKSGVDLRIVTPHIPDKKLVHSVTRSYYPVLLDGGVRIYEYTPGFMHAKAFVADDEVAVLGTINLDFRSLYLHFENGVWLYKTPSVLQIKDDFLQTLDSCQEVDLNFYSELSTLRKLKWSVLRLLAPLL